MGATSTAVEAQALRTIPKARVPISVSVLAGSASLAAYKGKFVYLEAITLDVTIMRGSDEVALVAGEGVKVRKDATRYEEFFVDPNDPDMTLTHISTGAATLVIHY